MRIEVTEEEAEAYLNKFFETYPGVAAYIANTKAFVQNYHFTYTYMGRRRRFPIAAYSRRMASRVARQAVNARIQSTSADIVSMNMLAVDAGIRPLGGRSLLTVHDSLVFQLPKGTPGVKALLDEAIVEKTRRDLPWLPVEWKYDCAFGPSYGEAKQEVT